MALFDGCIAKVLTVEGPGMHRRKGETCGYGVPISDPASLLNAAKTQAYDNTPRDMFERVVCGLERL